MTLGALIGGLYGLHVIGDRPDRWEWYSIGCYNHWSRNGAILGFYRSGSCLSVSSTYWFAVVGWSMFAAMVAGVLAYIWQLLRM